MRRPVTLLLLLSLHGSSHAQPASADSEPPATGDTASYSPEYMVDGSGYLGLVHYQDRARAFDDRRYAAVLGADMQRRSSGFFLTRINLELGGALDEGSDKANGFRFALNPMLGLGLGGDDNYVGLVAGIGTNGDVKGAVPAALTVPIEVSVTTWLASWLRGNVWVRGDRFLAAKRTRRRAADEIITDELTAGARVVIVVEKKRQMRKGEESLLLRGIALGVTAHRTMDSTVWTLQVGVGANQVPTAGN